jgi:hypothetical protein
VSAYAPWKALERRHAKRQQGERLWRPDFSDSIPDGQNGSETWDCKVRKGIAVISWFIQAERKYRTYTAGRRFHLCLYDTEQSGAGDFVLLRAKDYAELVARAD